MFQKPQTFAKIFLFCFLPLICLVLPGSSSSYFNQPSLDQTNPVNPQHIVTNDNKISSNSLFMDNFSQDTSFKSQLWTLDPPSLFTSFNSLGNSYQCSPQPQCLALLQRNLLLSPVPLNLGLTSSYGLNITQINKTSIYQAGLIESNDSFAGPFNITTQILSTFAGGNSFIFGIVDDNAINGVILFGNFNKSNSYIYGMNLGTFSPPRWLSNDSTANGYWIDNGNSSTIVSNPQINVWYTLSLVVNTCGFATLVISSSGKIIGSQGIEVGTHAFHIVLGQFFPGFFYINKILSSSSYDLSYGSASDISKSFVKYISVSSNNSLDNISIASNCVSQVVPNNSNNIIVPGVFDSDNGYLYAFAGTNKINVIDPKTDEILTTIKSPPILIGGNNPAVYDSVHQRIYILGYNLISATIVLQEIDANTNSINKTIDLTPFINGSVNNLIQHGLGSMIFDPTGDSAYNLIQFGLGSMIFDPTSANIYWGNLYGIITINTNLDTINTIKISYINPFMRQFGLNTKSDYLYVPSLNQNNSFVTNQISVINIQSQKVVKNITLGISLKYITTVDFSLASVFYDSDTSLLYIISDSYQSFSILIFNPITYTLVKNISIDGFANIIAYDSNTKSIIVPNVLTSELMIFNSLSNVFYSNISFLGIMGINTYGSYLTVVPVNASSITMFLTASDGSLLKFNYYTDQIYLSGSGANILNNINSYIISFLLIGLIAIVGYITISVIQIKKNPQKKLNPLLKSINYLQNKLKFKKHAKIQNEKLSDETLEKIQDLINESKNEE